MAKLSLYLPPFSPDYSGAGAMLFDLNALTVMHDAGGCTGNYTGHDEPRWYGSNATVFCSALRMIDAIMGNDQKLKDNVYIALKDLHPDVIALVGSPVPMVIGMDLKGLAHEIETETGIPTIGIETTGTEYYPMGAYKAAVALLEKFCPATGQVSETARTRSGHFNLLGATPLDFERVEDIDALQNTLKKDGYTCIARPGYGYRLDEWKKAITAEFNIAVSYAGYRIADYMEKQYGIPYLCGFPYGPEAMTRFLSEIQSVRSSRHSHLFFDTTTAAQIDSCDAKRRALIIGDQIIGASLKDTLKDRFDSTVGCLFGVDTSIPGKDFLFLSDEDAIRTTLSDECYDIVIADPLLKDLLPENCNKCFLPLPQYAVSGDIYHKSAQPMFGDRFEEWLSPLK